MRSSAVRSGADLRAHRLAAGVGLRELARALGHQPRAVEQMEKSAQSRPATIARYFAGVERVVAEHNLEQLQQTHDRRLVRLSKASQLAKELVGVLIEVAGDGVSGPRS